MKIFIAIHTDIWQGTDSQRVLGFDLTLEDVIELAKKDKDAVSDVKEENGQIVIYEAESGKNEELGGKVFETCNDSDKEQIISNQIAKDLKDYLTEDCKQGMAESHLSCYFVEQYKGKTKDEAEFNLNVNHDDSLEIENTEDELGRKLTDEESEYLIEVFHEAILNEFEIVEKTIVGWWDTCRNLMLDNR